MFTCLFTFLVYILFVYKFQRDHIGRSRFIGHSLKKLLFPGGVSLFERYWRDSLHLSPDGPHCCSNFAITFHLTTSITRVFQFYYLYYHLRPFSGGGRFGNQMAPKPKRPVKPPALTLDEQLKEQAMDKMFLSKLLGKSWSLIFDIGCDWCIIR